MSNPALVITYGDHTCDFNTLPPSSLVAMLRRGVSHYLGSEQASKVINHYESANEDATKEQLKAIMKADPEGVAKVKAEFQTKALEALTAGTVGVSTRGPSIDPIEKIIRRLAKDEILVILKDNGIKAPKRVEDTVTTANGEKLTMAQFIDRRLDPKGPAGVDKKSGVAHLERLTRDAKKIMDETARKAKKVAESVAGEGLAGL